MKRSGCPHNNERGMVLGIIILSSLMFSAAAVAVLNLSATSSQTANRQAKRLRARYAAEAGLVWAMQKLWVNDSFCGESQPPSINGCTVNVTVTDCDAKVNRQLCVTGSCP